METQTLPELSIRLSEERFKKILSKMCENAFKKYVIEHVFKFIGKYLPDVCRSGEHPDGIRGVECYLEFKDLSTSEDDPSLGLWTSNSEMNIHFSQNDIDKNLIEFATKQKHVPQGANVNHKCRVAWHPTDAIVEVIIDVSYDSSSDHK